jgi:transposase
MHIVTLLAKPKIDSVILLALVVLRLPKRRRVRRLHRARERLVLERTALINHLRALLLEPGVVVPQGRGKLAQALLTFADDDEVNGLSRLIWIADRRLTDGMARSRRTHCQIRPGVYRDGADEEAVHYRRRVRHGLAS